jgi:hypothetical protein
VRNAIERKSSKLARHHERRKATVLLLESGDIALMNEPTMRRAVRAAFPGGPPSAVDQIWYAETYPATAPAFYEFTARGRGLAS